MQNYERGEGYHRGASLPIHGCGQPLTPRQAEIISLYASGLRRAEIVGRLGISPKTLDGHAIHAKQRLGARTLTQAVAMWARGGA